MKTIFVFSLCVASALAGVQPWSRDAEENYLSLYRKYCSGSSSAGNDGDREWHCKGPKEGPTLIRKTYNHQLSLPSTSKQQLVFINTPSDDYQHDIVVSGQISNNHNTKIVVVPSTDSHNYQVQQNVQVDSQAGKPSIFYLRGKPSESGQTDNHRPWANSNSRGSNSDFDFGSNPRRSNSGFDFSSNPSGSRNSGGRQRSFIF